MNNTHISPNAARAITRLGQDIRTARKKRRFRQVDLAAKMGVSVGTLQRLEGGDPGVSIGVVTMAFLALGSLDRIEDALDVASDDVGLLREQAALPKRVRKRWSYRAALREPLPSDQSLGKWL